VLKLVLGWIWTFLLLRVLQICSIFNSFHLCLCSALNLMLLYLSTVICIWCRSINLLGCDLSAKYSQFLSYECSIPLICFVAQVCSDEISSPCFQSLIDEFGFRLIIDYLSLIWKIWIILCFNSIWLYPLYCII